MFTFPPCSWGELKSSPDVCEFLHQRPKRYEEKEKARKNPAKKKSLDPTGEKDFYNTAAGQTQTQQTSPLAHIAAKRTPRKAWYNQFLVIRKFLSRTGNRQVSWLKKLRRRLPEKLQWPRFSAWQRPFYHSDEIAQAFHPVSLLPFASELLADAKAPTAVYSVFAYIIMRHGESVNAFAPKIDGFFGALHAKEFAHFD